MRKVPISIITLLLVASLALAESVSYRAQSTIHVTAAASDTTITFGWDVVAAVVHPYDADLWVSFTPGASDPFRVPAGKSYTISAKVASLTLHRNGATASQVTMVFK